MANSSKQSTGLLPRQLQFGLDQVIEDIDYVYKGVGEELFTKVTGEKGYYEMMRIAGMGLAGVKGEGVAIAHFDSLDQHWVQRFPLVTYEKSCRITMEAIKDNVYMDLLPRLGKELVKAQDVTKDTILCNVLNNAFNSSYTGGDGIQLIATGHPLQAGGTNDNALSVSLSFSEDALEQLVRLVYNLRTDDGLLGDFEPEKLIYPTALMHEVERVLGNPLRPATAERDINAMYQRGDIKDRVLWKRLSSSTAYYLTTNFDECLMLFEKDGNMTQMEKEPYTFDMIYTLLRRYAPFFAAYQGIVGSAGA